MNPSRAKTKAHGFTRALMERPRTIDNHLKRAQKMASKWKCGEGDYTRANVADEKFIGNLRAKTAYIEYDSDEGTYHLLGFVDEPTSGNGSSSKTKKAPAKKAVAKKTTAKKTTTAKKGKAKKGSKKNKRS